MIDIVPNVTKFRVDINLGERIAVLKVQSIKKEDNGFYITLEGGLDFVLPKGNKSVDWYRRNKYVDNAVIRERFEMVEGE